MHQNGSTVHEWIGELNIKFIEMHMQVAFFIDDQYQKDMVMKLIGKNFDGYITDWGYDHEDATYEEFRGYLVPSNRTTGRQQKNKFSFSKKQLKQWKSITRRIEDTGPLSQEL